MMLGKGTQPVHKFMFDKEAVDIMYDNNPDFQQITPSNIKLSQFFLNSVVQKKKAQLNTINRQQPPPERSFESPSLLEAWSWTNSFLFLLFVSFCLEDMFLDFLILWLTHIHATIFPSYFSAGGFLFTFGNFLTLISVTLKCFVWLAEFPRLSAYHHLIMDVWHIKRENRLSWIAFRQLMQAQLMEYPYWTKKHENEREWTGLNDIQNKANNRFWDP